MTITKHFNIIPKTELISPLAFKYSSSFPETPFNSVLSLYNLIILSIIGFGKYAFYGSGLTYINIPNGVVKISGYAFHSCSSRIDSALGV